MDTNAQASQNGAMLKKRCGMLRNEALFFFENILSQYQSETLGSPLLFHAINHGR